LFSRVTSGCSRPFICGSRVRVPPPSPPYLLVFLRSSPIPAGIVTYAGIAARRSVVRTCRRFARFLGSCCKRSRRRCPSVVGARCPRLPGLPVPVRRGAGRSPPHRPPGPPPWPFRNLSTAGRYLHSCHRHASLGTMAPSKRATAPSGPASARRPPVMAGSAAGPRTLLEAARLQANSSARPWGDRGPPGARMGQWRVIGAVK